MNLSNIQDQIDLKRKLVEATDAVRQKYRTLKSQISDSKYGLTEFYEPVTTQLKSIAESVSKKPKLTPEVTLSSTPINYEETSEDSLEKQPISERDRIKQLKLDDSIFPPSPESVASSSAEYTTPDFTTTAVDQRKLTFSSSPTERKRSHSLIMDYLDMLKQNDKEIDGSFGVYINTDNKYQMGDSYVRFPPREIVLWKKTKKATKYPVSEELLDVLFLKQPKALLNVGEISDETKDIYRKLLLESNTLYKKFNPKLPLKRGYTQKYKKIIKPLIEAKGDGLRISKLPIEKSYKNNRHIEYIYWNNARELINRLRLLHASKLAGNTGHDNEILSIIEELREEGIIY